MRHFNTMHGHTLLPQCHLLLGLCNTFTHLGLPVNKAVIFVSDVKVCHSMWQKTEQFAETTTKATQTY